ncbi:MULTISPECIES: hypothetical protein [Rhodomicrobium]|uniref:hypothetical protein n=1 Tax=Rhodomicrobium TaxID=1068 RepID=UPI000B4ADD89|nr:MULTISPECIES: hypothetical protein [Rhodomicrobium]
MSKGLRTTAVLGGVMAGLLAMNAGAMAQGAVESGNASGKPIVEWHQGNQDPVTISTQPARKAKETYREVTEGQNQPTSYSGQKKDGARSGN